MGYGSRSRSNDWLARMQHLRDIEVNVYRSTGLEGGSRERKTAFRGATERKPGGWLSRLTRQGEPITSRQLQVDAQLRMILAASFLLNRSAAAVTTTTVTDDK